MVCSIFLIEIDFRGLFERSRSKIPSAPFEAPVRLSSLMRKVISDISIASVPISDDSSRRVKYCPLDALITSLGVGLVNVPEILVKKRLLDKKEGEFAST